MLLASGILKFLLLAPALVFATPTLGNVPPSESFASAMAVSGGVTSSASASASGSSTFDTNQFGLAHSTPLQTIQSLPVAQNYQQAPIFEQQLPGRGYGGAYGSGYGGFGLAGGAIGGGGFGGGFGRYRETYTFRSRGFGGGLGGFGRNGFGGSRFTSHYSSGGLAAGGLLGGGLLLGGGGAGLLG